MLPTSTILITHIDIHFERLIVFLFQPHDSYALFRSHHLNAAAKFECKDVPPGSKPPTFTVYASTLKFCERVKVNVHERQQIVRY